MTICYNTNKFKYTSIGLISICTILILTISIVEYTIDPCNDSYHNIESCLNSTTCEERYCEPSICSNYTCLPRVYKWCKHRNYIFYPDDECPKEIFHKISWIKISLGSIILLILIIYLITLIHYRCHYYYQYISDTTDWDDNLTVDSVIELCDTCDGHGVNILSSSQCYMCEGKGRIIKDINKRVISYSDI